MGHPRRMQLLATLVALSVTGCPALRKPGCESDKDCKGDRVCEGHRCAAPGPPACPKPPPCPPCQACAECPPCPGLKAGSAEQPEQPAEQGPDAPRTRLATGDAQVRGSLSKEVIRRVIRRHVNEVKYCYQRELAKNPGLSGKVVVQLTIGATGQVVMSKTQSSTLKSPAVESCIAKAVRRWLFPRPTGGGIVIVSYPFVLRTAQ